MPVKVEIDKDRRCVVIELPMNNPRPSASGKTTVIATSHGLASGSAIYAGRPVVLNGIDQLATRIDQEEKSHDLNPEIEILRRTISWEGRMLRDVAHDDQEPKRLFKASVGVDRPTLMKAQASRAGQERNLCNR